MKMPFCCSSPASTATRLRESGAAAIAPLGPGTSLWAGLNAEHCGSVARARARPAIRVATRKQRARRLDGPDDCCGNIIQISRRHAENASRGDSGSDSQFATYAPGILETQPSTRAHE